MGPGGILPRVCGLPAGRSSNREPLPRLQFECDLCEKSLVGSPRWFCPVGTGRFPSVDPRNLRMPSDWNRLVSSRIRRPIGQRTAGMDEPQRHETNDSARSILASLEDFPTLRVSEPTRRLAALLRNFGNRCDTLGQSLRGIRLGNEISAGFSVATVSLAFFDWLGGNCGGFSEIPSKCLKLAMHRIEKFGQLG